MRQTGECWEQRATSHLDALIDSIHDPVEEAAVDILGQSIASVLSLRAGPAG